MSSKLPEIRELELLIRKSLNENGLTIKDQEAKLLTAPGENYGSVMIALKVIIKSETSPSRTLNLVAKMIPLNELLREIFQVQVTFIKELFVYEKIVPAFVQLENEYGIVDGRASDLFCKFYGGRMNIKQNSKVVDEDAILLLENLKIIGFENGDRLKGFDYDTAVLILRNLAIFHATTIALKILKPDEFKDKVLNTLNVVQKTAPMNTEHLNNFVSALINIIVKEDEFHYKSSADKIATLIKNNLTNGLYQSASYEKPFTTFVHSDFWVNNMMIRRDHTGKAVHLKMVDFQTPQCQSLSYDLLFFLFSSISPSVLYDNVNDLIKLYYDSFIDCLFKKFQIKNLTDFSWDAFQQELKINASNILSQILFMYKPILLERGTISDMNEFKEDDLFQTDNISENCKYRMRNTFLWFVRKGWV